MSLCAIGLYKPKSAVNIGSALRAATCYGAGFVAIHGRRDGVRSATDTTAAHDTIPVLRTEDLRSVIPFNCVPVAVELMDGVSLVDYEHPRSAFYVFGPEDSSLGKAVTSWCRDIVYVPTKVCMNLAATVNVVLYDRLAKQLRRDAILALYGDKEDREVL